MTKVRIKLKENSYDVLIGTGLLRRLGRELVRILPSKSSQIVVVTSPIVRRHWGEQLEESLKRERLHFSRPQAPPSTGC